MHEIFDLCRVRAFGIEHEITFEMMKGVERIIQLIIVKQRELVMHVRGLRRAVEGRLVKIDRPQIIALGRLPIRFFDPLRVARRHHPLAAAQQ